MTETTRAPQQATPPKPPPKPRQTKKAQADPPSARPFRFRVFIFRMIAAIFLTEAVFLAASFSACKEAFVKRLPDNENPATITDHCPGLGDRAETLFVAALSTTLGLLSAGSTIDAP